MYKFNLKVLSRSQMAVFLPSYAIILILPLVWFMDYFQKSYPDNDVVLLIVVIVWTIIDAYLIYFLTIFTDIGQLEIELKEEEIVIKTTKRFNFFGKKYESINWKEIAVYEILTGGQIPFVKDLRIKKHNGQKILLTFLTFKKNKKNVEMFLNSFINVCVQKQIEMK
jgi:hypothetical protein